MLARLRLALAPLLALMVNASCVQQTATQAAAVCPPVAQTAEDSASLPALREKAQAEGAVRVIVQIAAPPGGAQPAMGGMQRMASDAFRRAGVSYVEPLTPRLPYVVAEVTAEQLDALYPDPRFPAWSEDRIARATLAESGPLVQAPQLWAAGGRGAGQSVAILDTGVDAAHPFLAGRVVTEACFSTTSVANRSSSVCPNNQSEQTGAGAARPCNAAGCEHGTHVAGIAAGRGTDFSGMAPDAEIIAVQVFSRFTGAACGGQSPCVASFTSDQIRALDFVLQQAATRSVASANMSLGGGRSTTACDTDLTKPVIDQLRAAGIATVIASGNDGFRDSVSFPGCISSAVTVGATSKSDEVASFSNCGPQVDLHAPGVNINSSANERFASFSGTSMATPHVAGAFAALRSLHTNATVDQIEAALKSSGRDVGGRPRILLLDASNALAANAPAEPAMANDGLQGQIAALAAMPEAPARFIITVESPQALARAETAARAAGASYVGRMGGQNMLAIEATPAQARALAASGAVTGIQPDRTARPQN